MTELQIAHKYVNLSRSAKKRDIEFTVTIKHLRKLMFKKKCYFTGQSFEEVQFTVDRLDSTKGYADDNTVACCGEFNRLKKDLTIEQIEQLYNGMKKAKLL